MRSILLITTTLVALGCGPRGLPVSDVSSYQLDHYDYAKNRLPMMEKIVDGQCESALQAAPLFEDEGQKENFIKALGICSNRIWAFHRHVEWFKLVAMLERHESVTALKEENKENTRRFIRADDLVYILKKMDARQVSKYDLGASLQLCLMNSETESDTTRCFEEAAAGLEKVLPEEE